MEGIIKYMDRKMVIFNALQTSLSGGIGRYSYELSKAIYNLNEIPIKIVIREEDKVLFSFVKEEDLIVVKGVKNSKIRNYYEQFVLPQKMYKEYPNAIIHYPDTMAPLFSKNKVVITVHDVSFKAMNNIFTLKTKVWKNIITKLSLKKAWRIVADTNFTKSEILKYYPSTNSKKVDVVHCGFNDFSKETINNNNINKDLLNVKSKDYILTVSTISPRKNIDGLIKAFNLISDEINYKLVIAGKNGWMYERVHELVGEFGLQDRVLFTGGINDDELKFLYKNSKLFVYPSFYEGFGLPPLEAMSYGIPCIVSNVTSIPEVVGNGGIYINPNDIKEMSLKIKECIFNEKLRIKVIQNANKRIHIFNWVNCAIEMISIYKEY